MSGVSLIIPTLNAEKELPTLLGMIMRQSRVPDEILVVDSSSDDHTVDIAKSYENVEVYVIPRNEFDHGGTRHAALERTTGDFVLFLTQDAVPENASYVTNLLAPFEDYQIAMVTGRQIPKPDARRFVQLVQEFNYPDSSNVRTADDIKRLGVKAFFGSDACSAYRRSAYEAVGGFPRPCQTNEDMLIASRFLRAGNKVAYSSTAKVVHSHNFSLSEQFVRNRTIGAFLQSNKEELDVPSEVGEGMKMVKDVTTTLAMEHRFSELLVFWLDCAARLLGNRLGKLESRKESR